MKTAAYSIQAGAFKAKCLDLMNQVNEEHITVTITKHGKAVAKLVPIDASSVDFFGCLKNKISIRADLTQLIKVKWEANT